MKTKKLIAGLCSCALLVSGTNIAPTSTVEADSVWLPFALEAPKDVVLDWLQGGDSPTTMQVGYNMSEEMCNFMKLKRDDYDSYKDVIGQQKYDSVDIFAQIDWAIDDPENGWHYNDFWDTMGYEVTGAYRVGCWDVMQSSPSGDTTTTEWIMRSGGYGDINDITNQYWYGDNENPGLKNQLKEGQYNIVNGEDSSYITIDYKEHTVYVRVRYGVEIGDMNNGYSYTFSDWSNVASYGKNGNGFIPYTESTIPTPDPYDLRITDKYFNNNPIAGVKIKVSDELASQVTQIVARGGAMFLEVEMRAQGTDKWRFIAGDRNVSPSELEQPLSYLVDEGQMIPAGSTLEFRCRFFCSQYPSYGVEALPDLYSSYSKTLTVTTPVQIGSGKSVYDQTPANPSTEKPTTAPGSGDSGNKSTINSNGDNKQVDNAPIYSALTGATNTQVDNFVAALSNDNDPKGTSFDYLFGRQKKSTKNAITLTWKKPAKASYFVIYGTKCGKKNRYVKIGSATSTSFTQSGLKKGTYYKFLIGAFDSNNKLLGMSNTIHIATKGGKYGNFKSVTTAAKKNKVTLDKKGKIFKLKGKGIVESKKLKVPVHRTVRYLSTNKKIATVDTSGKVTAKKKGKCTIIVYAQNGAFKKITVTVKK
ncbi:MAG: Ig-like domain-containing protein [Lachnospiraceae bacterium]|nr:Ig-like domain-containing protein [Lachnospiraceae bacterium]